MLWLVLPQGCHPLVLINSEDLPFPPFLTDNSAEWFTSDTAAGSVPCGADLEVQISRLVSVKLKMVELVLDSHQV